MGLSIVFGTKGPKPAALSQSQSDRTQSQSGLHQQLVCGKPLSLVICAFIYLKYICVIHDFTLHFDSIIDLDLLLKVKIIQFIRLFIKLYNKIQKFNNMQSAHETNQFYNNSNVNLNNETHEISTTMPNELPDFMFQNHEIQQLINHNKQSKSSEHLFQKLNYLQSLATQNQSMFNQVKLLNSQLDQEIKQIDKKQYSTTAKIKPHIKPKRSKVIQSKYKELDTYKKQLELKTLQKRSLNELVNKIENLKAVHKQKYMEIQTKNKMIKKLQKMLAKKQEEETKIMNNSLVFAQNYQTQIKELKDKIKVQSSKIYQDKQKFINEGKNRKKMNSSTIQLNSPTVQEALTPVAIQLKIKYEALGRRIDALKNHKKSLSTNVNYDQRKKYLQKLKSKHAQLSKL